MYTALAVLGGFAVLGSAKKSRGLRMHAKEIEGWTHYHTKENFIADGGQESDISSHRNTYVHGLWAACMDHPPALIYNHRPPAPITVEDCSSFDGKFQYRDAHPDGSASTDEEECERCPTEDSEDWACDGWHRDVTATVLGEEKAYYWFCESDSSQFEIPECAVVCKSRASHRPKTEMSPKLKALLRRNQADVHET